MKNGQEQRKPRVAVMGAGAVGCYFGGMLARAGVPVTLIGRPAHVGAIAERGLYLESLHFQEWVPLAASTAAKAVEAANIVLFSVKTTDTEEAARAVAPHLGAEAELVCMQNGIDGADRLRLATGFVAIPAVIYVAVEMRAPGHVKHSGRGELVIGGAAAYDRLDYVASVFNRAGVPCRISSSIETDLWTKMAMNCAYNAVSALTQTRYGRLVNDSSIRDVMGQATRETAAVARALGVRISADIVEAVWKLADAMPDAKSSTAQDLARGRQTEIDSLNGYVVRRGRELGIATPVNQILDALVRALERRVLE